MKSNINWFITMDRVTLFYSLHYLVKKNVRENKVKGVRGEQGEGCNVLLSNSNTFNCAHA